MGRRGWQRLALALLLLGPVQALPHPWHSSYAELGVSGDRSQLEVALRFIPEDLETVLSVIAERRVVLSAATAEDALVLQYLQRRFVVLDDNGEALALTWVGKEISYAESWMYFTVDISGAERPQLHNRFLLESQAQQENRVKVLWVPGRMLIFNAHSAAQAIFPTPAH